MSVDQTIFELRSKGVRLEVVDGDLRVDAPKGVLTDEIKRYLRQHKNDLIEDLAGSNHTSDEERLLGWASLLAEAEVTLGEPVDFIEAPLRMVKTSDVSSYARRFLKTISYSRFQQLNGGWSNWTPDWWRKQEQDAIAALKSMHVAMNVDDSRSNDTEEPK